MSIAKGMPPKKFFGRWMTNRQKIGIRIFLTVILLVPTLLGLGLGGYLTRGSDAHVAPTPKLLPVETMRVEAVGSYRTYRAYTGKIVARRTSDLGFERKGKLVSIVVEEGDRVAAGTLLARLDTQELKNSRRELLARRAQATAKLAEMIAGPRPETIAAARAQVNEFREQLALAKIRQRRRERLLAEKVISREQFDEAASQSKTLQAKVDGAQSRLDELLAGTRKEQIRAQRALIRQLDARLAAIDIELTENGAIFYDHGLDLRSGYSNPASPLFDGAGGDIDSPFLGMSSLDPATLEAVATSMSIHILAFGETYGPGPPVSPPPDPTAPTPRTIPVQYHLISFGTDMSRAEESLAGGPSGGGSEELPGP